MDQPDPTHQTIGPNQQVHMAFNMSPLCPLDLIQCQEPLNYSYTNYRNSTTWYLVRLSSGTTICVFVRKIVIITITLFLHVY